LVFLTRSAAIQPALEKRLRARAELHRGAAPLNGEIRDWLRAQGVPAIVPGSPIVFAAASAVHETQTWIFPFHAERKPRRFFGRRRSQYLPFIHGKGYSDDEVVGCSRVVIPTREGGYAMLASAQPSAAAALRCLTNPVSRPLLESVEIIVPRLRLSTGAEFSRRLQHIGIRALFDGVSDPFPTLIPRTGLSDIVQGIDLQFDETGVSVKAGTVMDIALSTGPKTTGTVVFDHPFVLRVVNAHGDSVALASISDLAR
jgi:hypothetical protein